MKNLDTTDDYQITFHQAGEAPSKTLVLTFGGQPSDLGSEGFGTDFCLLGGYDTIHVAQRYTTQYQGLSLEAFIASVKPVVANYTDIVCYGPSLGGYASLYYGGAIDARIIVAAPMLPAWPHLKNKSYADLEITHRPLHEVPKSSHTPVVIYDPMAGTDKSNIDTIVQAAYPTLTRVEVPFAGHPVLIALAQARILRPLIYHFFKTNEVMPFEPPAEGTFIWHRERGRHYLRSDPAKAQIELQKSFDLEATRSVFNLLIRCHIDLGDFAAAQDRLDVARGSEHKAYKLFGPIQKMAQQAGLTI